MITKGASVKGNFERKMLFYKQARQGMHDVIEAMHKAGLVRNVYVPGYVGWSPVEGSGIFDSISSVSGINMVYYKMTYDLEIDESDLFNKLQDKNSMVLLVNYFGFRDKNIERIIRRLKKLNVYIMEDNAHGFYTWYENQEIDSDFVVFSLHKMFPFDDGGSIVIRNEMLSSLLLHGKDAPEGNKNPYNYRIHDIAEVRKNNFRALSQMIIRAEIEGYVESLRTIDDIENNVPQTYPIRIKVGDRNKIYQLMNDAGFGVVSLYHTMINQLQNAENAEAVRLSKCIMNLPIHQDVNIENYPAMIDYLIKVCETTKGDINA